MLAGTVSVHLARHVVEVARQAGISPAKWAHLPDLAPEALGNDLTRVSTPSMLVLWELLTLTDAGVDIGTVVSNGARLGSLGVWDHLFTLGSTLTECVTDAGLYMGSLGDPGVDDLTGGPDGSLLTIRYTTGTAEPDVVAAVEQFAVTLFLRRTKEASRRDLVPARVTLMHEAPRRVNALLDAVGTRNVEFGAQANTLTFLNAQADAALPGAPPGLPEILRDHAEQIARTARPVLDWHERFRAMVESSLHDDRLSLDTVAARLAMSSRTLQRRLAEHNTSWRAELEAVRQEAAQRLLTGTDLGMRSIANRVGYADSRALRRAVRRWRTT